MCACVRLCACEYKDEIGRLHAAEMVEAPCAENADKVSAWQREPRVAELVETRGGKNRRVGGEEEE